MKNKKKKKMVKVNALSLEMIHERMKRMDKHRNCMHYGHLREQSAIKHK